MKVKMIEQTIASNIRMRRAQRIDRQIGRVERHRRDVERRQRERGLLAAIDDQHHGADHQNQRHRVPDVGPQRLSQCGRANILERHQSRLV